MPRSSLPFKYRGGAKQWEHDHDHALVMHEQSLSRLMQLGAPDSHMRFRALAEAQLDLGLHHAWSGNSEQARTLLRACSESALASVEIGLVVVTSKRAPDFAPLAWYGAAAAALVGDADRATTLFEYAQRLAAGLLGDDQQPSAPSASLDVMALAPLSRAYSLLRLGRLSGFNALHFIDPPPEGRRSKDIWGIPLWGPIEWQPSTIEQLLTTAEMCWRLGKPWREGDTAAEKGLFPLLRALVASLHAPMSPSERSAAQAELQTYFSMIRDLVDFRTIYLLVLDLQRAFDEVFTPVAPDPL